MLRAAVFGVTGATWFGCESAISQPAAWPCMTCHVLLREGAGVKEACTAQYWCWPCSLGSYCKPRISNPSSSLPESLSAASEAHSVREGKMGQARRIPFISYRFSLGKYARLAYWALRGASDTLDLDHIKMACRGYAATTRR